MTPEATDEVNEQQENAGTNHDMMPKLSGDSVNKYYAVFYTDPKLKYYWGKVTKTFTNDDDEDDIDKVEVDFLHQKAVSRNPRDWTWREKTSERHWNIRATVYILWTVLPEIKKGVFTFSDVEARGKCPSSAA